MRERNRKKTNRDTGANTGTQTPSGFYIHALYCPTSPCPHSNNMQYVLNCTSKTKWYIYKKKNTQNQTCKANLLLFIFIFVVEPYTISLYPLPHLHLISFLDRNKKKQISDMKNTKDEFTL